MNWVPPKKTNPRRNRFRRGFSVSGVGQVEGESPSPDRKGFQSISVRAHPRLDLTYLFTAPQNFVLTCAPKVRGLAT